MKNIGFQIFAIKAIQAAFLIVFATALLFPRQRGWPKLFVGR